MKISVVIPAYNEEAYLGTCLDSLMQQEVKPDEIIVVNNNSTDKTVAVAKKYPVRIVTEKEQGMIQARNRGFNEAQYEIIARTDADTIVPPDWIKKIKEQFKNKQTIAFSGPANFYDLPDVVQNTQKWTFSYMRIFKQIMKHDGMYGPNMALRKNVWEKIKDTVCMKDKDVHEDLDLAIHLAPFGHIIFDYQFCVLSSFRRWKKIESYIEYTNRMIKSISKHKKITKEQGKEFVKRIITKAFLIEENK
jgi:glycosyltransferase involved in cell wall biosynthesis